MLCPPTMPTSPFSVPLPKSWPKHAKAATLHLISLAHFVLTHVRGFAVNSPIHRVRLAAERDRLEIRIKDARMVSMNTIFEGASIDFFEGDKAPVGARWMFRAGPQVVPR